MDKYYRETNCAIYWIEIYSMDSVIHLLNKWGLDFLVPWTLFLSSRIKARVVFI